MDAWNELAQGWGDSLLKDAALPQVLILLVLTLVMAQTLKHGVGEGIKVSLAPLVTDLPIIFVVLLILDRLTHIDLVLGAISLFGAGYLIYLGYESLIFKGEMPSDQVEAPTMLLEGYIP